MKPSKKEFDPVNNDSHRGNWPCASCDVNTSCSFEKHTRSQDAWLNYFINPALANARCNRSHPIEPTSGKTRETTNNRPCLSWFDCWGFFLARALSRDIHS